MAGWPFCESISPVLGMLIEGNDIRTAGRMLNMPKHSQETKITLHNACTHLIVHSGFNVERIMSH